MWTSLSCITVLLVGSVLVEASPGVVDAARQAEFPIAASDASYDRDTHGVSFTLTNLTDRVITAWNVVITLTDESTGRVHRSGYGVDAYLAAEGLVTNQSLLNGGATVRLSSRTSSPAELIPHKVDVQPNAVVFADGTAVGDPMMLRGFFERRDRDRRSAEELLAALDTAMTEKGPTVDALRSALARMELTSSDTGTSPLTRNGIINIRLAIAKAENTPAEAATALDALLTDLRRRHEAARRHARPQR